MRARGRLLAAVVLAAATATALPAAAAVLAAGTSGMRPAAVAAPPAVTLSVVGDMILGNTPLLPAQPGHYLDPVAPDLRTGADVVFGNLEGTLTTGGTPKCARSGGGCYAFRNPPSFAAVYAAAGFDVLNLANNHSHDFGAVGLRATQAAITGAGMAYTGLPGQVAYLTRKGVRVAVVGFAPYGHSNDLRDLAAAARLIRDARRHASVVVVYMHAGAEGAAADRVTGREEYYLGEDRGNPRRFAHLAVDSGASLVVASGPHVLRGMEFYRGRLIAYSLANFADYRNLSSAGSLGRSAVLHVTLAADGGFRTALVTSLRLTAEGRPVPGGDSVRVLAGLSARDFGAASPLFSPGGRVLPRPAPASR